jgi:hypothetical protein
LLELVDGAFDVARGEFKLAFGVEMVRKGAEAYPLMQLPSDSLA